MTMIGIHPIHRRLAELQIKAQRVGGFAKLSTLEQMDLNHCMKVNADLVIKLDSLKQLSFLAHEMDDMEWQQELCKQIDELEVKFI